MKYLAITLLSLFVFAGESIAVQPQEPAYWSSRPIVIAHRGASGYRPEHTVSSFEKAIEQGADYLEPDLVMTRDGELVIRHDVYLSTTTDIADRPEFKDRRREFEGRSDWFVFDFTVSELKKLKTIQPIEGRSTDFNGRDTIMTFDELIDFVALTMKDGRVTGLYPEIKYPIRFRSQGLDPTEKLVCAVKRAEKLGIPIYLQSFSGQYLQELSDILSSDLVLLVDAVEEGGQFTPAVDVEPYLDYVTAVGMHKALFLNKKGSASQYAASLKQKGKSIHVWTVRNDRVPRFFKSVEEEITILINAGVDGIFSDFPDTVLMVRDKNRLRKPVFILDQVTQ